MAEEIVMNVKSNIKQVTKDTDDLTTSLSKAEKAYENLNEQVTIQKQVITDLEKELIQLEAQAEKTPKTASAGYPQLQKKIQETKTELKLEKNALKTLNNERGEASEKLKKNVKDQKELDGTIKDGIGSFSIMGVSINGLKSSFGKIIPTIKLMFSSIKVGILSTGIGALLIAFGAMMTYLTNTKRGAEKLEKALAQMGAAISVITDRISMFGDIVGKIFDGDFAGALDDTKAAFSGITDEINAEVEAMGKLKDRVHALKDADNEFMMQKAQTRQEIEKARLIAEDETKSAEERVENLKKALELEEQTTQRELELARERVAIQQEEMALSENMFEDEEKLAQLKTALIEAETTSIKMKRRVVASVNSLEREIEAEEIQRAKDKADREKQAADEKAKREEDAKKKKEEEKAIADEEAAMLKELENENMLAEIEDLEERALMELEIEYQAELKKIENHANFLQIKEQLDKKYANAKKALDKDELAWSKMTADQKLALASNAFGSLAKIMGKESKAGKAAAIAQATIATYTGATKAYQSLAGIPYVGPVLGGIAAAGAVVAGFKNIKAITATKADGGGGGGGGGGGAASVPAIPDVSSSQPAPQMMSGAFDLGSVGAEPEPIKAFVVTDEMSNSQNQLSDIRNRSTI